MKEEYVYWNPSKLITSDYLVKTIVYGAEGISVILESRSDEKKTLIKLNFGASVDLYRVCDEGVRQSLYSNLKNAYGDILSDGGRFVVKNSNLIKWLEEESGYLECFDLKHFILMNEDSVFDIVARSNPDIEMLE